MDGRFQRGNVKGISPFFAFQDIITSAMAVLITVVMLLAINLQDVPTTTGEPVPAELRQKLTALLDELSQASTRLRAVQDATAAAKLHPAALRGEIDQMRAELAGILAITRTSEAMLAQAQRSGSPKVVEGELAKQKAALEAAEKQLAMRQEDAARLAAEMKASEEATRAQEDQLLAEQARKNEIWLIPDRSKTTKEPILAVVSADAVILQRFDHPESNELRGGRIASKFKDALKGYAKLDQYIVFYFKPSGVEHFEKLTEAAKESGFEIGYDAVGEEIVINFRKMR